MQIIRTGDKGVSAGENSRVSINKLEVKQAKIAIASKDMSNVLAKNIFIADSEIGFAAYQKKSEFGPAKINVAQVSYKMTDNPFLLESRSTLLVDGIAQSAEQNEAYKFLYPNTN